MWLAVDPPTSDTTPQEGLLNVRDFHIKGEAALDRVVANGPGVNPQGVGFSGMRAEFVRQTGQLRIKDGVLRGPTVGATIEGNIDYTARSGSHERHLRSALRSEQYVRSDLQSSACSSVAEAMKA